MATSSKGTEILSDTTRFFVAHEVTNLGERRLFQDGRRPSQWPYAAIVRSRACSSSRRNSGCGARHMVRYVSRKGSQISEGPREGVGESLVRGRAGSKYRTTVVQPSPTGR